MPGSGAAGQTYHVVLMLSDSECCAAAASGASRLPKCAYVSRRFDNVAASFIRLRTGSALPASCHIPDIRYMIVIMLRSIEPYLQGLRAGSSTLRPADACSIGAIPSRTAFCPGRVDPSGPVSKGWIGLILQRAGPGSILAEASSIPEPIIAMPLRSALPTHEYTRNPASRSCSRRAPSLAVSGPVASPRNFSARGCARRFFVENSRREARCLDRVERRQRSAERRMEARRQRDRRQPRSTLSGNREAPPSTRRNIRLALRRQRYMIG